MTNKGTLLGTEKKVRVQFMADVAHDLKTPLNGIIGFTNIIMKDPQRMNEDQVHQLKLVYQCARQLENRINALVQLLTIEAGIKPVELDWLRPESMFVSVIDSANEALSRMGLTIGVENESSPARIRIIRKYLKIVMDELVSNAIKNTSQGDLTIGVSLEDSESEDKVRVVFFVSDTGVGLSPESVEQISKAFDSNNPDDEVYYTGVRLGLALARQAALAMNGRLIVESSQHQGSKFSLKLDLPKEHVEL
jgi:signal transduction histidine kinase